MNAILGQPLASFLNLRESENSNFLLEVDYTDKLQNHYNSFHASVLFSFAEYSSGAFLVRYFPSKRNTTLPIMRSAQVKYSNQPTLDTLVSQGKLLNTDITAVINELENKGRSLFEIQINLVDSRGQLVFKGIFEWFITMKP